MAALLRHPEVAEKTALFSTGPHHGDISLWVGLRVLPVAIQWWNVWYPGAEPGGGCIAQRMRSARNERQALGCHIALQFPALRCPAVAVDRRCAPLLGGVSAGGSFRPSVRA